METSLGVQLILKIGNVASRVRVRCSPCHRGRPARRPWSPPGVVFVPAVAVGAVGVPVKAGLSSGALPPAKACTNAVVATWVVFVVGPAVGAVGAPVRAGEVSGALPSRAV
jgi:hypothetical protein